MSFVWMALVGFVVGLVARAILPGTQNLGLVLTTVLGVAGSFALSISLVYPVWEGVNSRPRPLPLLSIRLFY